MAKKAAFLPSWVQTVGAMIDARAVVCWSCQTCGKGGPVALQVIARDPRYGRDYSLVEKHPPCRPPCSGRVHFRYSGGLSTMTRRLEHPK